MNKFFNRPISPHLSIYVPQISSLFSIWHRISAIYIFTYLSSCVTSHKIMLIFSFGIHSCFTDVFFHNYLFFITFYYHLLNGTKYIFWDLNSSLNKTGSINFGIITCGLMLISQVLFFKNLFI